MNGMGTYNQTAGNAMGFPCQGATGNTRYFFIGDQQGHNENPQAQGGGAPAGQGCQPGGGFGFPGGNTGPMGKHGCDGGPPTRSSREPSPSSWSTRWSSRESGTSTGAR